MQTQPLVIKYFEYLHGEPVVKWNKKDVQCSIIQQQLQYAVLVKFSYGIHVIEELQKAIPIQRENK